LTFAPHLFEALAKRLRFLEVSWVDGLIYFQKTYSSFGRRAIWGRGQDEEGIAHNSDDHLSEEGWQNTAQAVDQV
jgi:hypothetical protein